MMTATVIDYSPNKAANSSFMLEKLPQIQMVEKLLQLRLQALGRYRDIMSFMPFEYSTILQEVLEDFCESVVDYTAEMHFGFYSYLDSLRNNPKATHLTAELYPLLVENTQKILDFHDQYNSDIDLKTMDDEKLTRCINQVGELLADRVLLEDQLLETL